MSKLYIFLCSVFLFTNQAKTQDSIHFVNQELQEVLQMARIAKKPVFLFCYANWCSHCNHMKATVLKDPEVIHYFNEHFICAKFEMESGVTVEQKHLLKIKSFPTYIFMTEDGQTVYRFTGETKSPELIQEAANSQIPEKQIPYIKSLYYQDSSNTENCYTYLRVLRRAGLDYSSLVHTYFSTQTDEQLLSEPNWRVISNGINDINSREYKYVLNHLPSFAALGLSDRIERKTYKLVNDVLSPLVEAKDSALYFEKRNSFNYFSFPKVDSLYFITDLRWCERTNHWDDYKRRCLEGVEKYAWMNFNELKEISGKFLVHITDISALKTAILWVDRSVKLSPETSTYIIGAKLSLKAQDLTGAVKKAEEAKEFAVKNGWDSSEADKLLVELKNK